MSKEIVDLLYEFNTRADITIESLADLISDIAKPMKHGHWIPNTVSSGRDSWTCSVCGRRARGSIKNLPYCHCGARMDEV